MVLLDQMITTGRLYEFIGTVISMRNDEQEEKVMWEFWLHKDFERSYAEFIDATNQSSRPEPKTTSKKELVEIVKHSIEITSFVPQE